MRRLIPILIAPLLCTSAALAAVPFADVPENAWYRGTLESLIREQAIDSGGGRFRPADAATRAEFVELIVILKGGFSAGVAVLEPFFDDVPWDDPQYLYFQQAAKDGLLRGAGNCVGTHPCHANPGARINRAEAATILNRAFDLKGSGDAPLFDDMEGGAWYVPQIQIAADRCVLRGDSLGQRKTRTVRPAAHMNRAEMITMVDRSRSDLLYGVDCGELQQNTERLRPPRSLWPDEVTESTGDQPLPPPRDPPAGISLMRFDVVAHPVQDAVLRGISFEAAEGSLLNAENYALWVDHDRNGVVERVLEGGVSPESGEVTFHGLYGGGYTITEQSVTFELRADIKSSPISTTLQMRIKEGSIVAEELDGETLVDGLQIQLNTTPGKVIDILPQGNLFVTQSAVPVSRKQILGGTDDAVLRLEFLALEEAVEVTNLRIESVGSVSQSIEKLLLLKEGESVPFAQATVSGCTSDDVPAGTYCASLAAGQLIIPEDERMDVFVHARIKTDDEGGVSGDQIQLWLPGQEVDSALSGTGSVNARGAASGNRLTGNNGDNSAEGEIFIGRASLGANTDIIGSVHETVMAKISSINASDITPIKMGISPLRSFAFRAAENFNSADGTNIVEIEDLLFSVGATNLLLDAGAFTLFNSDDMSEGHTCVSKGSAGTEIAGHVGGSFYVECSGITASTISTSIDSGRTVTLTLQGIVVNPQVESSTDAFLQVELRQTSIPQSSFGINAGHIHYLDSDAAGAMDVYWVEGE